MIGDRLILEEINDPAETARCQAQHQRGRRNLEWLEAHWNDLLPRARGKYVAVAGEEAFIVDTPEEAWAWAESKHPEDNGAFVRYVIPEKGPRIYAHHR